MAAGLTRSGLAALDEVGPHARGTTGCTSAAARPS